MNQTAQSVYSFLLIAFALHAANPVAQAQQSSSTSAITVSQPSAPRDGNATNDGNRHQFQDVRVQAIEQRIGIIKEIMARKQKAAEEAAAAAAASRASVDSAEQTQPTDSAETKGAGLSKPALAPAENQGRETRNSQPMRNDADKRLPSSPLEELEISTSPLNSMELANSLFITGHYSQALKGYQSLLNNQTHQLDRDWLRCLAANCHRVLGQVSQAERLYRDVVASKQNSYPADHSKWYLDHLTRRKQLQTQLQAMHAELEALSRNPKK
jgi:tetratricopeptide (TPR) repeat protein